MKVCKNKDFCGFVMGPLNYYFPIYARGGSQGKFERFVRRRELTKLNMCEKGDSVFGCYVIEKCIIESPQ